MKSILVVDDNEYNRELLGYDFFISEDLLDRPTDDFVGLTRRYLAAC